MKKIFAVLGLVACASIANAAEIYVGETKGAHFSILSESVQTLGPDQTSFVVSAKNKENNENGTMSRWRVNITGCSKGGGDYKADRTPSDYWTTPSAPDGSTRMSDELAVTACKLARIGSKGSM